MPPVTPRRTRWGAGEPMAADYGLRPFAVAKGQVTGSLQRSGAITSRSEVLSRPGAQATAAPHRALSSLSLAAGAVIGRALALHELADRAPATPAGLPGSLIYIELLAEIARGPVGADVIAQRRTSLAYR